MSTSYDYEILSAISKSILREAVILHHKMGYVCVGGLNVTRNNDGLIAYDQAMERQPTTINYGGAIL